MEDWKYKKARKRVKKIKGFYRHFTTWVIFSAFFIAMNIATDPGDIWAIFPILGWGIGVAMHAIGTFGLPGLGRDWETRMLEREIDRIEREEQDNQLDPDIHNRRISSPKSDDDEESPLPLKELRKEWRDSDFV